MSGAAGFVLAVPGGAELLVRVVPRAGRTAIAGIRGSAVLCRVAAAPVDGAANDALRRLVAEALGIPTRQVTIRRGARSRDKVLRIAGIDASTAADRLAASV